MSTLYACKSVTLRMFIEFFFEETLHTPHASNAGTYLLAEFPVFDSHHPPKYEGRVLM